MGNKNINKRRKLISGKIFNPINTKMKNIRLETKKPPQQALDVSPLGEHSL